MENQYPDPGARARGFPSPAKTNGKSIIQPWRQGRRIPKSCKNKWKINPPTLAPGSEDSQVLQKPMENQSSNPGARVGGFSSPAKINGKSILQPWRQGLGIPKSCRTWDSSDPGAMVGGLIFHWFLQKSMENQFYNPGSKVGGFPSPAKNH